MYDRETRTELGVALEALVAVLHRLGVCHELSVGGGAVRVEGKVVGVALDGLGVVLHRVGVLVGLETLVALLLRLLRLALVEVVLLLLQLLLLLRLVQCVEALGVAVLRQRLVEELDRVRELALLAVGVADAEEGPGRRRMSTQDAAHNRG